MQASKIYLQAHGHLGGLMCDCDHVSWDDYFDSVVKIIEAGGPMAEIVRHKVEEDFKETVRFLKIVDKWLKDDTPRTIRFKRYSPLPLAD